MKNYSIYLVLLAAWVTSCTDMDESRNDLQPVDPSYYVVTGTISGTGISSRMADIDSEDDSGVYTGTQTTFQSGDPILIGWSENATTYTYRYSGENGIFNPATDASTTNYGLWKELVASTAANVNVYAWYGQPEKTLPTADNEISVQSDQTLESAYLKSLRLAAHASVAPGTCKELQFSFKHLMAGLRIRLVIDDREVTSTDIIGSSATIVGVKIKGKISIDAQSKEYQLSMVDGTTENVKMYKCPWSEKTPYWIDFKCLLPAQTLPKDQKITVTLANGKKYSCTLGEDVALQAGKITSLPIELKAKGGLSVFVPICTVLDASRCAFSGNRILSAVDSGSSSDPFRFLVYDKKPDGTWGEGEPVYDSENSTDKFPSSTKYNSYSFMRDKKKYLPNISIYGDNAVVGYAGSGDGQRTFFIKKSKTTGKWFCANGPFDYTGYAVAISDKFLITGAHLWAGNGRNCYIYPIDEEGNLGKGYVEKGMSGYKLSLAGNILATNNGVYQYDEGTEKWTKLYKEKHTDGQRIATDGKRVIIQADNETDSPARIYDLNGNEENWGTDKPRAGVDSPVGINGDYALVGESVYKNGNVDAGRNFVNICYRNSNGIWNVIDMKDGFLTMMKHWDSSITATELVGGSISMKGTRALIVSKGKAYFIENIDKMVEDWINNPYTE